MENKRKGLNGIRTYDRPLGRLDSYPLHLNRLQELKKYDFFQNLKKSRFVQKLKKKDFDFSKNSNKNLFLNKEKVDFFQILKF